MPTVTVELSSAEHAAVLKRVDGINAKRLQEIGIGAIPQTQEQKDSAIAELRRRLEARGMSEQEIATQSRMLKQYWIEAGQIKCRLADYFRLIMIADLLHEGIDPRGKAGA